MVFKNFFPNMYIPKVQDMNLEILLSRGIRGLILDVDNTLVPNYLKIANNNVIEWINQVRGKGFEICIVSNASKRRITRINNNIKAPIICRAGKPRKKSFIKALGMMKLDIEQAAVVGDQIFTDVYGGNKLNMFTILVEPIDSREFFLIKVKRWAEKLVLRSYSKSDVK